MAGAFENQKTGVRILFGVIIGILALSMLLYLIPQGTTTAETSTDTVARIGDQTVTLADVHTQLNEIRQRNQIPQAARRTLRSANPQSACFSEGN